MEKYITYTLVLAILSIGVLSQQTPDAPTNFADNTKEMKAFAHSRLHIYNFPSPATERGDKSPDASSLSAHYFNVVQTCSKRDKERAMRDKRKYDYDGDKNAIAVRWLPDINDKDFVMELSFHFG